MVDEPTIYRGLGKIFADIFMREDISLTASTTSRDVEGWDSMRQVEIILAAEEHFQFRARSKDLDALRCVGDLVALIERKSA